MRSRSAATKSSSERIIFTILGGKGNSFSLRLMEIKVKMLGLKVQATRSRASRLSHSRNLIAVCIKLRLKIKYS